MRLWIAGTSGAALEVWAVAQALREAGDDPGLAGFLSLDGSAGFPLEGLVCMREAEFLGSVAPAGAQVLLAVGDPKLRRRLDERFRAAGYTFPTLVHPAAVLGRAVRLGPGCVVMAGAVLETSLSLGRHCLVNVQASVAHECRIGDYCNLGPGARLAGRVELGDGTDAGAGSVFRPGVRLGGGMVIGCGAAVVQDWPGAMTIAGNPARQLLRPGEPARG